MSSYKAPLATTLKKTKNTSLCKGFFYSFLMTKYKYIKLWDQYTYLFLSEYSIWTTHLISRLFIKLNA